MPRELYHLTSTLADLIRHESMEVRRAVGDNVDAYMEQIRSCDDLGPVGLAREAQAAADVFLADGKRESKESRNIQCSKGCCYCCSQIVSITSAEAVQLVQVAREKGIVLDRDRLTRQLPYVDNTWASQSEEDRACPFLGSDGTCKVYEDRPLSCRKYHVISQPVLCDLTRHPSGQVQVWFDGQTEMLTTAAFTYCGSGFMPQMLLEALDSTKEEL